MRTFFPFLSRRAARTLAPLQLRLDDGADVTVDPVTPKARPLIERAMAKVSAESSRRRFFAVRRCLSDAELDHLTRMDGWRRFALGATATGPEGVEGLGVARFARLDDDPRAAEVALIVVDPWQGRGLGRLLLARLALAALERGIDRLTGLVLPENTAMLGLLERLGDDLLVARRGEHLEVEARLDPARIARLARA